MARCAKVNFAPRWFTPNQGDEETPAEFYIQPIKNSMIPAALTAFNVNRDYIFVTNLGLFDWRNIEDENGNPLAFSKDNMHSVDFDLMQKAALEILSISVIDKEEKKT